MAANEGGGTQAFIALVDAPGLPEWRQALVDYLAGHGIKIDQTHGYTPHITLAYVAADAPNPLDAVPDLQFVFDKATLSFGDVRRDYLLSEDVKGRRAMAAKAAGQVDPTLLPTRTRHAEKWQEVLARYFGRQYAALIGRVRDNAGIETVWSDGERWDNELSADMLRLNLATAAIFAKHVADQVNAEIDPDQMMAYLSENAERSAAAINATTRDQVAAALLAEVPKDAVKNLFEIAKTSRAQEIAGSHVNAIANFGSHDGARQSGLTTKTWQHNGSKDPRSEHIAMDGETVGIEERFSNGARWPGDPILGAEQNAHCRCSVVFGRGR